MLEWITQINNAVNGVVWGPAGLALLFGTGLIMSVRTGFFQFRKMGYWLRHTIGAIFTNKDVTAHTSKEDMAISQFQSMCTALATSWAWPRPSSPAGRGPSSGCGSWRCWA